MERTLKRTTEEIKAWRLKMKDLAAKVRALPEDKQEELACQYGTITAEGHKLSRFNTIFLSFQAGRPLAQIGGYRQWEKAGRQVIKGQHAIGSIFVPISNKNEAGELPDDIRFLSVPVFDITQTEELNF